MTIRDVLLKSYHLVTSGVLEKEDIEWVIETKSIGKVNLKKEHLFYRNLDTSKHDDFFEKQVNERLDFFRQHLKNSSNPWMRYTFLSSVDYE